MLTTQITNNDFEPVFTRESWGPININNMQNGKLWGLKKNVKFNNDIYGFWNLTDVTSAITMNQMSRVVSTEINGGESRLFLVTRNSGIVEMMDKGLNYLHETILNYPIKMFVDIDLKVKHPSDYARYMGIVKETVCEFMDKYNEMIQREIGEKVECVWMVLESHKPGKKISYHLIANHAVDKIPIFYKNVLDVVAVVNQIVKATSLIDKIFDTVFYAGKGLRMFMCAKMHDRDRTMNFSRELSRNYLISDSKTKTLVDSMLHMDTSCKTYVSIAYNEDTGGEEEEIIEEVEMSPTSFVNRLKEERFSAVRTSADATRNKKSSKARVIPTTHEHRIFTKIFLEYLSKTPGHRHLRGETKKFKIYRCKDNGESGLIIALKGCVKCTICNYDHTHNTGRSLFVRRRNGKTRGLVKQYCAAKIQPGHPKFKENVFIENDETLLSALDDMFVS